MSNTATQQQATMVRPQRDIVASYTEQFRRELQTLIDQGQRNLVIDLGAIEIIDSTGLALFMMCHNSLAGLGGKLTVITANPDLRHLFHVTRLDEHFTVAAAWPV